MNTPASTKLLQWGLRHGFAGTAVAGTMLCVWWGFSIVFAGPGGWVGAQGSPVQRVEMKSDKLKCCSVGDVPSKDGTLNTWDFSYRAACSKGASTAACVSDPAST